MGAAKKGAVMQPAKRHCRCATGCVNKKTRAHALPRTPAPNHPQGACIAGSKKHAKRIPRTCTCNKFSLLQRRAPVACLLSTQRGRPSHAMLGKASKR